MTGVTRSYLEFQAAVLRALPRDINPDVAFRWTQNRESLARVLREALASTLSSVVYPLFVDYERSVEDGVKAGQYDWWNPDIISRNFSTKRKGTSKVEMEIVHFNRDISTSEVLHELDRMGYRPAELHELLAFGEKYPKIQRQFPIVALAPDSWYTRSKYGYVYVPYLDSSGPARCLGLDRLDGGWFEPYRFAAVRK